MLIKCVPTLAQTKDYLLNGETVFLLWPRRLEGSDYCAWLQRVKRKPYKIRTSIRSGTTYTVDDALNYERMKELHNKALEAWQNWSGSSPRPPYPSMYYGMHSISLNSLADQVREGKWYVSSYKYEAL